MRPPPRPGMRCPPVSPSSTMAPRRSRAAISGSTLTWPSPRRRPKPLRPPSPRPSPPPFRCPPRRSSPSPPVRRSLAELVADHGATETDDSEHECLAGAVYFESKGESLQGQLSVAEVVLNRTRSGRFPVLDLRSGQAARPILLRPRRPFSAIAAPARLAQGGRDRPGRDARISPTGPRPAPSSFTPPASLPAGAASPRWPPSAITFSIARFRGSGLGTGVAGRY